MFTDRTTYGHSDLQDYLFWWRLPLILLGALSLIPIYSLLKKLFNKNIAIMTTVLLGLSPVVIGMSQVVNPDATLWSTAFLSFISFMLYIKTNKQKYVLLSGLFFGLGLLSKYFISIFYIFYFIIIYIEYLIGHKNPETAVQRLIDLAKIVAISLLVYAVFFPANWFDYRQIILGSLGSEIIRTGFPILVSMIGLLLGELLIFNGRISGWVAERFDLRKIAVFSLTGAAVLAVVILGINALIGYKYFDLNSFLWVEFQRRNSDVVKTLVGSLYTTLFVLTLPTLAGIGAALYMGVKEKLTQLEQLTLSSSFAIILMFAGGAAIGGFVATGRYQIMLIPLYVLIAAIGIDKLKRENLWIIVVSLISLVTVALSSPFYLNYQNSLASKGVVVNDPWGLGGYELANRMNKLPHAEDIRVWSDREGFNEFFVGKTYWRGKDNPFDPILV
jgi:4-amino-4-deoxy-L-arabinose transferase-like glycosyltransferase